MENEQLVRLTKSMDKLNIEYEYRINENICMKLQGKLESRKTAGAMGLTREPDWANEASVKK